MTLGINLSAQPGQKIDPSLNLLREGAEAKLPMLAGSLQAIKNALRKGR